MNAFIKILGIKVTGDLFVTSKGLSIYLEGNVWDLFYAQLDIHAGVGRKWYELELSVRGRFVANARRKRQTQTVTKSFQGSYLDALRRVVKSISDYAQKRLSQAQNALGHVQQKLSRAQHWFDKRIQDVRNANRVFDSAVRSLGRAKQKLEAAKGPFKRALARLNAAQRRVDRLCKIRRCRGICIPGIKCKWCHKRVWGLKIPYPCCRRTNCMIRVPNILCGIKNLACYAIRGIAFLALEAAKIFIRIPMLALDAAKLAVSAVQVIVDKSRVVLKVAEVALEAAKLTLQAVKIALEAAKFALEVVKKVIGAAAEVLNFVIRYGLQSIIDVRNCGFLLKLSTVDVAIFDVSCEVNAFKLGWKTMQIRINFRNVLESIWSAAKATINFMMRAIGGILTGKRKREVAYDMSSKLHFVLRKIRKAGGFMNTTYSNLNETIDVTEDTLGSEQNVTTDYEQRTSLFAYKCKTFTRHFAFLNNTLETLNGLALDSVSSFALAENVSSLIEETSSVSSSVNITAENVGINVKYGKHYNLTEEQIRKALKDAEPKIQSSPDIEAVRNMSKFSQDIIKKEISSMEHGDIAETWILALENVTEEHFNKSECAGFSDCVLFSVSMLYEIFAVNDHANISEIRTILNSLEDDILSFTQNVTYEITGIYNTTSAIKENLQNLKDLNIFCLKAPKLITSLRNVTTELYGNASFYCRIQSDTDVSFWWYKGDNLITGEHSSILTLTNVTTDDEPYRCISGNVVANITSNDAYIVLVNATYEYDICSVDNGGCEHICKNVSGKAECLCSSGFVLQKDLRSCADIDECQIGTHDCQQLCKNTIGSFNCSCEDGFTFNDSKRECSKVKDACETRGLNCSQTAGCKEDGNGSSCFCNEGYTLSKSGELCEDIDECALNKSACKQGCKNQDGGYECFCNTGFSLEENSCHECEYPTWGDNCSQICDCVASTTCDPVKGCICEAGWRGTKCDQDIDECKLNRNICRDKLKECINEDGGFECVCLEGYEEDENGTCQDVKECSSTPRPCEQLCIEREGGYRCACVPGFLLEDDGKSCKYECIADCKGQSDGNYQSCATLSAYVSCVGGSLAIKPCPFGLLWYDNLKRCKKPDLAEWQ